MKVYTAPESLHNVNSYSTSIFLAGTIDNGKASHWQTYVIQEIAKKGLINTCIINPRKPDWDANLDPSVKSAEIYQQVMWELKGLELATVVVFYFEPGSISPISLLELGHFSFKARVVCPEGYTRKANVDIYCEKFDIPVYDSLDALINDL